MRWMRIILPVIIGLLIIIIWLCHEWNRFINNDEILPGRDTVAFWSLPDEDFSYEILGGDSRFRFVARDSIYIGANYICVIDDVHLYANTAEYIYIVAAGENQCFAIEKKTGKVFPLDFNQIPATEKQVCFINLQNDQISHVIMNY